MTYTNDPARDYEVYQAHSDRERWAREAQERLEQTAYWWSIIWDRGNPDADFALMKNAQDLAHYLDRCVARERTLIGLLGENGENEFRVRLTQEILTRLDERNRNQ